MTPYEHQLPLWATLLLERLIPYRDRGAIIGDFAEIYAAIAREEGVGCARRWYAAQVLSSLPAFILNGIPAGGTMLRNYVTTAARNLRKRKFYATLNVGGLAIGMAICLLIFQYVAYETSYDAFHEHRDDLYRVNMAIHQSGTPREEGPHTFRAMGGLFADNVPEVATVARFHPGYGEATIRTLGPEPEIFRIEEIAYVDADFFEAFTFQPMAGDPRSALAEPGGVVLTESAAKRFFGDSPALGEAIEVFSWAEATHTVRAIIEDPPSESHLDVDVYLDMHTVIEDTDGQYADTGGWSWSNFITYVVLRSGADPAAAAEKINEAVYLARQQRWDESDRRAVVSLQRVDRIHLYNEFDDDFASQSAYRTILFVTVIGLFVLLIAWLNYINLSTARALERAREVGIRKAAGARRTQVVSQFVVESLLVNGLALVLAVVLADRAIPWLNQIGDVEISRAVWQSSRLWLLLGGCFGVGALLASLYPAFVLSAFRPARILKGLHASRAGGGRLRQGLVVFQFAISITLLAGTFIVFAQMSHLRGVDLGLDLEQVLIVERPAIIPDGEAYRESREVFKSELEAMAAITGVTTSTSVPGNGYNLGTTGRREGQAESDAVQIAAYWVNTGFFETWGIPVIEGRALSADHTSDADAVMLNRTAAAAFGFASAEEAVGSNVVVSRDNVFPVVGVTEDYSWMSAKTEHTPLVTFLTRGGSFFSMKVQTAEVDHVIDRIASLYATHFPGNAFQFEFADQRFDELYRAEERLARLVRLFSFFALLVAALGLLGLAALTASQRRKEISVRKVLGASELGISRLLTSHFAILIGIAMAVAVPVTWIAADRWLDQFASRIALRPEMFVLPAVMVFVIALAASAFHVWRAARSSPIAGIRAE